MTDKIIIKGLTLNTIVGVYDFERENRQRLVVDLELDTDFSQAAASDELSDTINYAQVAEDIEALSNKLKPQLLEYLAEHICQHLFSQYAITRVDLTLTKPDILTNAQGVGVRVIREKK